MTFSLCLDNLETEIGQISTIKESFSTDSEFLKARDEIVKELGLVEEQVEKTQYGVSKVYETVFVLPDIPYRQVHELEEIEREWDKAKLSYVNGEA